jgi:hypothetical protein
MIFPHVELEECDETLEAKQAACFVAATERKNCF